jgi:hypothetical protein
MAELVMSARIKRPANWNEAVWSEAFGLPSRTIRRADIEEAAVGSPIHFVSRGINDRTKELKLSCSLVPLLCPKFLFNDRFGVLRGGYYI